MPLVLKSKASKQPPKAPLPDIFPTPGIPDVASGYVWVSWPQPDKITILGELKPEHFTGGATAEEFAEKAGAILKAALKRTKTGLQPDIGSKTKNANMFFVKFIHARANSPTSAGVTKDSLIKSGSAPKLRLEFNPRKTGEDGLAQIEAALTKSKTLGFDLFKWLADAQLTRLDLAVDTGTMRLMRVALVVNMNQWDLIYPAFGEKFGKPTVIHSTVRNGLGATFPKVAARWSNGSSSIVMEQRCVGEVDHMCITYRHAGLTALYGSRHPLTAHF